MHYHPHGLAATTEAAFCYRNKVIQQPAVAAASNLRLQSSHLKYKSKSRLFGSRYIKVFQKISNWDIHLGKGIFRFFGQKNISGKALKAEGKRDDPKDQYMTGMNLPYSRE